MDLGRLVETPSRTKGTPRPWNVSTPGKVAESPRAVKPGPVAGRLEGQQDGASSPNAPRRRGPSFLGSALTDASKRTDPGSSTPRRSRPSDHPPPAPAPGQRINLSLRAMSCRSASHAWHWGEHCPPSPIPSCAQARRLKPWISIGFARSRPRRYQSTSRPRDTSSLGLATRRPR